MLGTSRLLGNMLTSLFLRATVPTETGSDGLGPTTCFTKPAGKIWVQQVPCFFSLCYLKPESPGELAGRILGWRPFYGTGRATPLFGFWETKIEPIGPWSRKMSDAIWKSRSPDLLGEFFKVQPWENESGSAPGSQRVIWGESTPLLASPKVR